MLSFSEHKTISERFVNAINDDELKNKYKDQVWDILQQSYAAIGGIKGSGFGSPDDMVEKIPFWKMVIKNGRVHAVVMYKDSGGRKSVAVGADGSDYAMKHLTDIFEQDIFRSFGEKSKAALGKIMKTVPWSILQDYTLTPQEAKRALRKDDIVAVTDADEIPSDGEKTLARFPELRPYAYIREIGGKPAFKVAFGTPGKKIR